MLLVGISAIAPTGPSACAAAAGAGGSDGTHGQVPRPVIEEIVIRATRRAVPTNALDRPGSVRRREPGIDAETTTSLLRGVPGLFFQQTTPGQSTPILRGLRGSQVLHLVDGIRLNDAIFRDAPNQYLALVPTFALEAVEVLPGPAPALYGADALGGVVALRTRVPEPGSGPARSARLQGTWDSADLTRSLHGELTLRGARVAASLGGGLRRQGNRAVAARPRRLAPTGYEAEDAHAAARVELGERHALELSGQWLHQPATPRYDELVPGFGRTEAASDRFLFLPNERTQVRAGWRWDDAGYRGRRVRLDLARQRIVDDRLTQDAGAAVARIERNRSCQDALVLQIEGAGGGRPWVGGLEAYRGRVASRAFEEDPEGHVDPARARFPDGATTGMFSVFLVPEWPLTENLALTTGLRATRFTVSVPRGAEVDGTEIEADELTGRLGLRWAVTQGTDLLASASRGFRPPNVFDLGTLGPRPGNRFNRPAADLDAEALGGGEFGLRHRGNRVRLEAFAFRFTYRDRIRSVDTGATTPSGRDVVTSINGGTGSYRGIEVHGRIEPVPGLDVSTTVTWVRGEDRYRGETTPADRVPPVHGHLWLHRSLGSALRVTATMAWAAPQDRLSPRDQRDPRIDPRGTEGWARLDLGLEWRPRPGLRLNATVGNVLDRAYREHGSGLDAPARHLALGFAWNP